MKKKITLIIKIKRHLKNYEFINNQIVPLYRYIKNIYKNIISTLYSNFSSSDLPSLEKIFWINPDEIVYHTNYKSDKFKNIEDRVFDMIKHRNKIKSGDWDKLINKFQDLEVFKAFKERITLKKNWKDTVYYKNLLTDIKNGFSRFSCTNEEELILRFQNLDVLIENINRNGYKEQTKISAEYKNSKRATKLSSDDEITINITREGKFLFQNGRHRLSIAILLGISKIPVKILVRHKKWVDFRKRLHRVALESGGKLYQPALHIDLVDIPAAHDCEDRFESMKNNLTNFEGLLLDVGANLFYFCQKFEELGFKCLGVEKETLNIELGLKILHATDKEYSIIKGNILESNTYEKIINNRYEVVLLLNILHHFLKNCRTYEAMTRWLQNLKSKIIFFEPHLPNEPQMADAYINYNNSEFLTYVMNHTNKKVSKPIFTAHDGRTIFMIT